MIWNRAVCGQVEDEVVSKPAQVVYSVAPSENECELLTSHILQKLSRWRLTVVELHVILCGNSEHIGIPRHVIAIRTQSIRLPTCEFTLR